MYLLIHLITQTLGRFYLDFSTRGKKLSKYFIGWLGRVNLFRVNPIRGLLPSSEVSL